MRRGVRSRSHHDREPGKSGDLPEREKRGRRSCQQVGGMQGRNSTVLEQVRLVEHEGQHPARSDVVRKSAWERAERVPGSSSQVKGGAALISVTAEVVVEEALDQAPPRTYMRNNRLRRPVDYPHAERLLQRHIDTSGGLLRPPSTPDNGAFPASRPRGNQGGALVPSLERESIGQHSVVGTLDTVRAVEGQEGDRTQGERAGTRSETI